MTKYRYLKKYSLPVRDLTLVWRFFSVALLLLGGILVGNAVTPILAYQLKLSPKFLVSEALSPLAEGTGIAGFSLANQVLNNQSAEDLSLDINRWFIEIPLSSQIEEPVKSYSLSIPRLKITEATVKVDGEIDKNLVHFPGTAPPGKTGKAVIFGHSSLVQFFSPKNYKSIFSTLPSLKKGEEILVDYDGVRYTYLVEKLEEVQPNESSILAQRYDDSYLSLVTCVPPGTFLRRLVVTARLTK